MLELAIFFLANVLLATIAVWAYRKVSGLRKKQIAVQPRQKAKTHVKLGDKQGVVTLTSNAYTTKIPFNASRSHRLRPATSEHKAPWGW